MFLSLSLSGIFNPRLINLRLQLSSVIITFGNTFLSQFCLFLNTSEANTNTRFLSRLVFYFKREPHGYSLCHRSFQRVTNRSISRKIVFRPREITRDTVFATLLFFFPTLLRSRRTSSSSLDFFPTTTTLLHARQIVLAH